MAHTIIIFINAIERLMIYAAIVSALCAHIMMLRHCGVYQINMIKYIECSTLVRSVNINGGAVVS